MTPSKAASRPPLPTREEAASFARSYAPLPRVARRYGLSASQVGEVREQACRYGAPAGDPFTRAVQHALHEQLVSEGQRIRLEAPMADEESPRAPKAGTEGTIRGVGHGGVLMVDWDDGSNLNLMTDRDSYTLLG